MQFCDTTRERVRLVKMYFKKMQLGIFLKFKDGHVEEISAEKLQADPLLVSNSNVIRISKVPVRRCGA